VGDGVVSERLKERLAVAQTNPTSSSPPAVSIFDQVRALRPQLQAATKGTPVDVDRFLRVALTELRRTPKLVAAEPSTILGGLMLAGQLGLEIGSALGHCWLVPFRNKRTRSVEAVFILGYKGMIALARRSGDIESVVARPVHAQDRFAVAYGLSERLEHEPSLAADPGPVTAVYALARYVGGGHSFVVLTAEQVESYRQRSRAADEGPWVTDWEAMACKTAVRRLASYLPLTVEAARAVAVDEAVVPGPEFDIDALAAAHVDESAAATQARHTGAQTAPPAAGGGAPVPAPRAPEPPAETSRDETSQAESTPGGDPGEPGSSGSPVGSAETPPGGSPRPGVGEGTARPATTGDPEDHTAMPPVPPADDETSAGDDTGGAGR
jgi:recombination protein RecT